MAIGTRQFSYVLSANCAPERIPKRALPHSPICGQRRLFHVPVLARAQPNGHRLRLISTKRAAVETVSDVDVTSPVASNRLSMQFQPTSAHEGLSNEPLSASSSAETPPFSWKSHWWPLMPESYLRADRPNPITLLGIPMVAWRDGSGSWRVFKDRCPHRLAPLSEGRVESDGTLSCSYHGWRFCGSGGCTRIPQAVSPAAEAAACSSRRSAATSYPVQIKAGMLWVWPEEGPAAATAAAASSGPIISNDFRRKVSEVEAAAAASNRNLSSSISWYMREMPYSYEVLVENLTDPAHLPFSHHGTSPRLQRPKGVAMPMQPRSSPITTTNPPPNWAGPDRPDFEYDFVGNIARDGTITVNLPYLITYNYPGVQIELHAIPVGPGRSRFFSVNVASPRPPPMPPLHTIPPQQLLALVKARLDPTISMHMTMSTILDGDSVFLTVQDEVVRNVEAEADAEWLKQQDENGGVQGGDGRGDATGGGNVWSRAYYTATPSDSVMLAVRKWLEERAGGGPFRARQRQLLLAAKKAAASAAGSDRTTAHEEGIAATVAAMLMPLAEGQRVPGQAPSPSDRARLLNRYEQHTRHCSACRTRLQQLQALGEAARAAQTVCLMLVGLAAGMAAALAAVAAGGAGVGGVNAVAAASGWPLAVAAVAAVAAAGWAGARLLADWAQRAAQVFIFVDYVHAERD